MPFLAHWDEIFLSTDCLSLLKFNNKDPNLSFDLFYSKLSLLIHQYNTPTRKLSNKQLLDTIKSWITKVFSKLIAIKDKILKKNHKFNKEFHISELHIK